ncbi:MAG: Maf family protein [Cocleimonas sp.]
MSEIILASASPRRAELLDQIGVCYQVQVVDIDESPLEREAAEQLVKRLAIEKSQAIDSANIPVLGADTLGVIDNRLLVKPQNYEHAHEMLSCMSGSWHEILSAVAISYEDKTDVALNKNNVLFRCITDDEIKSYWQTSEPQDKAGAYAIQGLAALFIERIEGSYSGIMGLPLFETAQLLSKFNIQTWRSSQE